MTGGTSLADAVKDYAGRGATSNVIELGWVSPGDLDTNLETAVWKLATGSVSDPVEARGGLHLAQVIDRRESRVPPFSEVAEADPQAREQDRVFREEIAKYMVELEKKSLIVAESARGGGRLPAPTRGGGERGCRRPGRRRQRRGRGSSAGFRAPSVTPPPDTTPRPGTLPTPKPVDATVPEIPPPGI